MVILPWGCWVAANFLPALSVDKAPHKREGCSQSRPARSKVTSARGQD